MPAMNRKIKYLPFILLFSILFACNQENDDPGLDADFAIEGLQNLVIRRLVKSGHQLFAATDHGLYMKNTNTGEDWVSRGLSDRHLSTFLKVSDDYWLAASFDYDESLESFPLFVSVDQGAHWEILENDFGGEAAERIADLDMDAATNTLFAAGNLVIAQSSDMGIGWTPVYGDWGGFGTGMSKLKYHEDQNAIWVGGQNAIEQLVLIKKSITNGEETQWSDLLPSPSVVKAILFDPEDPARIIIGGEGGVVETKNGGVDWNVILPNQDYKFIFGLVFGNNSSNTIYASGWNKNYDSPQELVLYHSNDGGQTWKSKVFGDKNLFGGAWDMVSTTENNKQVLYMALYKGGIARIQINGALQAGI